MRQRPAGEGAALTATAVLDRRTTAIGAPAPTPRPSFDDDQYARQLDRRLTDERSSASSKSSPSPNRTVPDAAIAHRAGVEPTSKSAADPLANGIQHNPFVTDTANDG